MVGSFVLQNLFNTYKRKKNLFGFRGFGVTKRQLTAVTVAGFWWCHTFLKVALRWCTSHELFGSLSSERTYKIQEEILCLLHFLARLMAMPDHDSNDCSCLYLLQQQYLQILFLFRDNICSCPCHGNSVQTLSICSPASTPIEALTSCSFTTPDGWDPVFTLCCYTSLCLHQSDPFFFSSKKVHLKKIRRVEKRCEIFLFFFLLFHMNALLSRATTILLF